MHIMRSVKIWLPLALLAIAGIFAAALVCSPSAFYVLLAYSRIDEWTTLRGYPTIDPPPGFSGIWTHYKYDGSKLADLSYMAGKVHGISHYYRDDGSAYLIRRYDHGEFAEDVKNEGVPSVPPNIPAWLPAHYFDRSPQ